MRYVVVPHEATSDAATLWVAAIAEPTRGLELEIGAGRTVPLAGNWTVFEVRGQPMVHVQRVRVGGLEPDRRYPVRLARDGSERAQATLVTLPEQLPALHDPPFICLLGSCFAQLSDEGGSAGAAFVGMAIASRPHVKFMCGDQVYLDTPPGRFLWKVHGEQDLRAELLARYVAAWTQVGTAGGFTRMLREGATFFTSDDHELWNNAPNRTPLVRATWWPGGDHGAAWLRIATELFDMFQTPARSAAFKVGRLSFRVLDTRLERTADRARFTTPAELAALDAWVGGLDGPGALVLGQPIFATPAGPKGHLFDWGLPDFGQYAELVRILQRSRHDLLVLTGDVHYGRISGCRLPSGASLIEIIASPFALVSGFFGGKWQPPPSVFPPLPVAGAIQPTIWVEDSHRLATNQFATLEFWADGPRVRLSVRAWEIPGPGVRPTPRQVFQRVLE